MIRRPLAVLSILSFAILISIAGLAAVSAAGPGQDGQGTANLAATALPYHVLAIQVASDDSHSAPPPTSTPTHTPTATPTVPSTPSPTSTPAGILLRNGTWQRASGSIGSITVVGEVVNNTSQSIEFVQITANFYSASNQLLATDHSYSTLGAIPAHGDSPYSILLYSPPAGVTSVTVQVTDYDTPATFYDLPSGLTLKVTNSYVDAIGVVHFVGTVKNESGVAWDFVEPVIALYDEHGAMVRTSRTYTSPRTLGPGQSATFDLLMFDSKQYAHSKSRAWVDATSYR